MHAYLSALFEAAYHIGSRSCKHVVFMFCCAVCARSKAWRCRALDTLGETAPSGSRRLLSSLAAAPVLSVHVVVIYIEIGVIGTPDFVI